MIIDGLSWHQFSSLPHIAQLPLNRQLIEYEIYNQNLIHEVYLTQQLLIQQEVVPSSAGSAAALVVEEEGLPSGCIEFTYNTTDGTFAQFTATTSASTNYTITWGDGTEVTDVIDCGITIEHEYADSDTEYTVRLCFDDISLVTKLDLED
jgi:hypothetical protein